MLGAVIFEKGLTLFTALTAVEMTLFALEISFWMLVLKELAALFTKVLSYAEIGMSSFVTRRNKLTAWVAAIKSSNPPLTTNSKKHKNVER